MPVLANTLHEEPLSLVRVAPRGPIVMPTLNEHTVPQAPDIKSDLNTDNTAEANAPSTGNLSRLQTQAEKAMEKKYYNLAAEYYCEMLQIKPNNKDALLGLISVDVNNEDLNNADDRYKHFLCLFPDSKTVWIDYAKLKSWNGDYIASFKLLDVYKERYGVTNEYLSEKARVFSMLGYPEQALCLVEPLLCKTPNDYELLFTEASALQGNREPRAALNAWCDIEERFPKNEDNKYLRYAIWTPNRSELNFAFYGYHDTDSINMRRGWIAGKYFINPETSLIYGLKQDRQTANIDSGLEPINGGRGIWDNAEWLGLSLQATPKLNVGGLFGIGSIQHQRSFFRYDFNATHDPNDFTEWFFQHGQELYAWSPRAVSLRILQKYNRLQLNWQPHPQRFLEVHGELNRYSDGNFERSVYLYPHGTILANQYLEFDLGPYAFWQSFTEDLDNGYYDPHTYQLYELMAHFTLKPSDNINYIVSLGVGTQKDETMIQPGLAGDIGFKAIFGIYCDWQFIIDANISARNGSSLTAQNGIYRQYTIEAILTKRF